MKHVYLGIFLSLTGFCLLGLENKSFANAQTDPQSYTDVNKPEGNTPALQTSPLQTSPLQTSSLHNSGVFTKKRYSIKGGWRIYEEAGQTHITFNEAFKTKGGPDLKVYLSPAPLDALNNNIAVKNSIKIGVLKSNKGAQTYTLPDHIDVSKFQSLIIHCEAFSVLWGGFELKKSAKLSR